MLFIQARRNWGGWRAAAPQISAKVEVLPIDIDSE